MRILIAVAFLFAASAAAATPTLDWDGTWSGRQHAPGDVQFMMVGNQVVGLYLHGVYLPNKMHSTASPNGRIITITWGQGSAVLTRSSAQTARAVIAEPGRRRSVVSVTHDP